MSDVGIRTSVISANNTFAVAIYAIASVWLAMLAGFGAFLFKHREARAVVRKSPLYLGFMLVGSALMTLGVYLQYVMPSLGVCLTQVWSVTIGFTLLYGSAAAKNLRIWYIFSNDTLQTFRVTNAKMFAVTLCPMLTLVVLILSVWSGVAPFTLTLTKLDTAAASGDVKDAICASASAILPGILFGCCMVVLALTAVASIMIACIANKSRRVGDYNESLALGLVCMGVALFQILAASIAVGFINEIERRSATLVFVIMLPSGFMPLAMFVPLLSSGCRDTLNEDSSSRSNETTTGRPQPTSAKSDQRSRRRRKMSSSEGSDEAYSTNRISVTMGRHVRDDPRYFFFALNNEALINHAIKHAVDHVVARKWWKKKKKVGEVDMATLRSVAAEVVSVVSATNAGPGTTVSLPSPTANLAEFQKHHEFRMAFAKQVEYNTNRLRAVAHYERVFTKMMGGNVARVTEKEEAMLAEYDRTTGRKKREKAPPLEDEPPPRRRGH